MITDTIVALATPSGVGAIGIVRLSGENSIDICNEVFNSIKGNKDLREQKSHTLHFGTIVDEDKVIDEVLVSIFKGNSSYTGETSVEVSCHGSDFIIQKLIELFIRKGARSAQAGEFTLRAFFALRASTLSIFASDLSFSRSVDFTSLSAVLKFDLRWKKKPLLYLRFEIP